MPDLPVWDLRGSQLADFWLLTSGALGELHGYSSVEDITASKAQGLDSHGNPLPLPVSLEVTEEFATAAQRAHSIFLRHPEGHTLARLDGISVHSVANGTSQLGGRITMLGEFPVRAFPELHRTASETISAAGSSSRRFGYLTEWFPTRDVISALGSPDIATDDLLVVLSVDLFDHPDRDQFALVKAWQCALKAIGRPDSSLVICPVPQIDPASEALLGAEIASNYGCTHQLVTKLELNEQSDWLADLSITRSELSSLEPLPLAPAKQVSIRHGDEQIEIETISECAPEIEVAFPASGQLGFTVFFTGLPASGKSTLAGALSTRLMEQTDRSVTLLDGDIVRKHLSSELGFSREHRDLNITRIGYVASEITRHGGVAVCAAIAPYDEPRARARELVARRGEFIEVYVSTPLSVCEQRDPKGLYALARSGKIRQFTGIDDPYEPPKSPEVVVDTSQMSIEDAIKKIIRVITERGLIGRQTD